MKKTGAIIIGCYLCLVAISILWILYLLFFDRVHSEFSGVPLVILSLPGSIIFVPILEQINPYLFDKSPLVGIGVGLFGALLNSLIIYSPFYFRVKKENTKRA